MVTATQQNIVVKNIFYWPIRKCVCFQLRKIEMTHGRGKFDRRRKCILADFVGRTKTCGAIQIQNIV